MKTLEQRVQALEDAQQIINLKTSYLDAANGGWNKLSHDGDAIADMFVDDGHWELTAWAVAKGKAQIRDTFNKWTADIPFAVHMASNPFLEVDGDMAKGRWNLLALSTHVGKDRYSGEDIMSLCLYDDQFVRHGGRWLFKSLHAEVIIQGPFRGEDWTKYLAKLHKPVGAGA